MPYTTNFYLPRLRMRVANLVLKEGFSTRKAARHTGFNQSTVVRWTQKARITNQRIIPTRSSRPLHHPHALKKEIVYRILNIRSERNQCAEILHWRLSQERIKVSLSSVKRVLKRYQCSRFTKWKKWHQYPLRPLPEKPGMLVEIDTIHEGPHENRLYVYSLLDVCTRWAHALITEKITTHKSLGFIEEARKTLPFSLKTLQSDHGPEFSKWFTKRIVERGMAHRHSRVRKPTDNGHLERFNRTLQDEFLHRLPQSFHVWKKELPEYLKYYNTERPHMALQMQTPLKVMRRY